MTGAPSPFGERRRRIAELYDRYPHAAELLDLYGAVLDGQEPVYGWVLGASWRAGVRSTSGEAPALELKKLPWAQLESRFRRFVNDLRPRGTEEITAAGATIIGASSEQRRQILQQTGTRGDLSDLASTAGLDEALLAFYGRAFLQTVVEALASELPENVDISDPSACPHCGWPPQVAILRDEAELKSRRLLVCSLCATLWPAPRLGCPSCGETESTKLLCHEDSDRAHLRVDECQSCQGYLKSVDLRQDGHAVPLVDDIASIELDLWAGERELWKVCPNLLGY